MKNITLGIIAPSSVVPKVELDLAVKKLNQEGFEIKIHPTVLGEHWFYSATDQERAQAFIDFALDPEVDVLWSARGGYGATQLLPIIEKATKKKKIKKKLLLGYSDSTPLLEFARVQWGWKTVHAPMPALKTFSDLDPAEWSLLMSILKDKSPHYQYPLQWIYKPKNFKSIQAPFVGGNFSVWNSVIGTPYAGNARGKILFFEDVQENIGRLNRMIHHLEQAGGLKGVKAIVLGDFLDCKDTVPLVFKIQPQNLRNPKPEELMPLRLVHDSTDALHFIFKSLGERTNIPIFCGLPVGHGPHYSSLILGAKHTINAQGNLIKL